MSGRRGLSEGFVKEAKRQGAKPMPSCKSVRRYEIGSLPEMPVPGIVYDKLAAMRR